MGNPWKLKRNQPAKVVPKKREVSLKMPKLVPKKREVSLKMPKLVRYFFIAITFAVAFNFFYLLYTS